MAKKTKCRYNKRMDYFIAPPEALGESEVFLEFQRRLGRVAQINRSVLIIGERGSGKELAATRLHFLSTRWDAPFVTLNCSALPPGLIESELFGHESGSFTGATGKRKGRFEEADSGSLFLDEIGLIPIEVQEKILRTVEYGTFQRVGSSRTIVVDVRIIAATNQDLPALCDRDLFKQDLLDRLSFEVLFLPPLRERRDDLLMLADYFAQGMARELGRRTAPVFSDRVKKHITSHRWPGNIRELKNAVERAVYREDGHLIRELVINPFQNPWISSDTAEEPENLRKETTWPLDLRAEVRALEEQRLSEAMLRSDSHQGKAAKLLGLSYNQFRGLFRRIGKNEDSLGS